ncbi:MAG: ubiquinol-cytochrome c reductase iron-sulfur subunit [bacterium]
MVTTAGAPILLAGCAGLQTIRAHVEDNKITIAKADVRTLAKANAIVIVKTSPQTGSIILRNLPDVGIIAVSSVCSHRGCEVRPMPRSSRCPCHGSEYDELGEVLEGPASRPLQRYEIEETSESLIIKVL